MFYRFNIFLTLFSLALVAQENYSTDKTRDTRPNLNQMPMGKNPTSCTADGKLWLCFVVML